MIKKRCSYLMSLTPRDDIFSLVPRYWSNIREGGVTSDLERARVYSRPEDVRIAWMKLRDRPSIGFVKHQYTMGVVKITDEKGRNQ